MYILTFINPEPLSHVYSYLYKPWTFGDSSRSIKESSQEKNAQEAVETLRGHSEKAHKISWKKFGTDKETSQEHSEKTHRNQLEKGRKNN